MQDKSTFALEVLAGVVPVNVHREEEENIFVIRHFH